MLSKLELDWLGNELQLFSDNSLQLESGELLISDLHIGKTMHFRRNGLAVPSALAKAEIDRLENLLQEHQCHELIILGDLFHSKPNSEWEAFFNWMDKHSGLRVSLVLGNHDRHLPIDFHPQLEMVKEKSVGDIRLVHEPSSAAQHPSISGHIHPTFYLRGKAKQGLKFPCFYLQERQIILPAFGRFTGGYKIKPSKGSRVVINSGTNLQLLNF